MLSGSTNHPILFVRETARRTRPANRDEILAALGGIDYRAAVGATLDSPSTSTRFLTERCARLPYEVFGVVYVDNRNRVIAVDELFQGTIDGAAVHPREVVRAALMYGAAAVILFHNHPSGTPEPSQADELITMRLREALALVEIRTLDHLIIGGTRCTSLAERGII